jgi:hypothetical protein
MISGIDAGRCASGLAPVMEWMNRSLRHHLGRSSPLARDLIRFHAFQLLADDRIFPSAGLSIAIFDPLRARARFSNGDSLEEAQGSNVTSAAAF